MSGVLGCACVVASERDLLRPPACSKYKVPSMKATAPRARSSLLLNAGVPAARRRWCFLPFIPGLCLRRDGTWRLPQREMRELATSIRKVARVLWAVHVTFQEARSLTLLLCCLPRMIGLALRGFRVIRPCHFAGGAQPCPSLRCPTS